MRKVLCAVAGGTLAVILSAPAAHAARPASQAEGARPGSGHVQRHDRDRGWDERDRGSGVRDDRDRDGSDEEARDDDGRDEDGSDRYRDDEGCRCHGGVLGAVLDRLWW
jgi:hypothetical protein